MAFFSLFCMVRVPAKIKMRTPKYRRHSTRDKAYGQWKGDRTYFPGKFGSLESRRGYQKWLRKIVLAESAGGPIATDGTASIADCIEAFLEHAEKFYGDHRGSEFHNFVSTLMPLGELLGVYTIDKLTPKRLESYLNHLAETPGRRGRDKDGKSKPWIRSRVYCNDCLKRTRRMLKWLAKEGIAPLAVYQGSLTVEGLREGKSPAKETDDRLPVAWENVLATLAELHQPIATMVQVQWLTSCRPGQVCRMRWEDIDQTGELWIWTPRRHKTKSKGKKLTIFIGPKCQALLLPFRGDSEFVFTPIGHRAGEHYQPLSYYRAIERAAARAKVDHWTPYQIRHARGTQVEDTYDVLAAQAALGHARLDTTKIYTSNAHARARTVAREIG